MIKIRSNASWMAACACLLGGAMLPASAENVDPNALPDIGSPTDTVLIRKQEREKIADIVRDLNQFATRADSYAVDSYIRQLGFRIAEQSGYQTDFHFFVVASKTINAFAVPGGLVIFNSGLILASESEAELAGVMAHEIAHLVQRHGARLAQESENLPGLSLAAIAAAILVGTQNPQAGLATLYASQGGILQYQIENTREKESEADRVGMQLLANAGLDPQGMPRFFERMGLATRYSRKPAAYLSTHPVTEARIADTLARAEQYPPRHLPDSIGYRLAKIWLRVWHTDKPKELARRMEQSADSDPVARYGIGLIARKLGRIKAARQIFQQLHDSDPGQMAYLIDLADAMITDGDEHAAIQLLSEQRKLYPENLYLAELEARAHQNLGDHQRAAALLRETGRLKQLTAPLYKSLARSEKALGHEVAFHMAMAEFHYLDGEIPAAVDQLERAQRLGTADNYQASLIAARLALFEEKKKKKKQP